MTINACADLVQRGDPDRFAAVMAAPVGLRARLFPLYAFNLEVARAPWVTKEPLIAEMRLQWWRDVVVEPARRAHDVAGPLFDLIHAQGLPVAVCDTLIAARRWDVYHDAFADTAAFTSYLDDTGGGLMWLAALACGANPAAEPAVRAYGWAAALAGFLRAVPVLITRGRHPLIDTQPAALRNLANLGLQRIKIARAGRALVGQAGPALLAGWQALPMLQQVAADPRVVLQNHIGQSEFARRAGLIWQTYSGRW